MKNLILYILLVVGLTAHSQDILWEKSYGGIHGDYLLDALSTQDFGFLLAGSSVSDNTGNKKSKSRGHLDYWLWKMDEHGTLEWEKAFGGSGTDFLNKVVATRDGGFLLAGYSNSPKDGDKTSEGFGYEDYWVIKLNADGSEQWQKTLGGIGNDKLITAMELPEGGYLLAGTSNSPTSKQKEAPNYGNLDYWLVQLSAEGDVVWEQTFGGKYRDTPVAIAATDAKSLFVLGYSNSPSGEAKQLDGQGGGDFWLIHLDNKGTKQWEKVFGGEKDDRPSTLVTLKDGSLLLGGISNSENTGTKQTQNDKGTDFWLLNIDTQGRLLSERTYNIGQYDILSSIIENEDGSLLLGGFAKSEKVGKKSSDKKGVNDYVALKVDEKGEELWRQEIGSNGDDILQRAFETRDGSYVLAGITNGGVSRDKNGSLGGHDFWLVKLGDEDKDDDESVNPVEAFPNPTSGFTNVIITEDFETGSAYLFDLQGRMLQEFDLTSRTLPVNLGALPVGVYLINIETDTVTGTVKIIKKD